MTRRAWVYNAKVLNVGLTSFIGSTIVGVLTISWLADSLGRKRTIALGGAPQAGAANVSMLITGRLIAGAGLEILSALVPMYCSEITEASYRGAVSGLFLAIRTSFLQGFSPLFMERDRHEESREALYKLHVANSNDEHLELEFAVILGTIVAEKTALSNQGEIDYLGTWNSNMESITKNYDYQLSQSNHLQPFGHRRALLAYCYRYLWLSIHSLLRT
ncbi:hypothetical protein OCU04_011154 [Sclerotinia nivalis]|uniref:Major facilitator superfamily (MFS) profile domain-containing protein n=1 Tax=Sclerotinia nivalis TaxID=352851 RepID=A0A9X0DG52_9HELO|nr:hypothetical protein OCU04_011154 [Sclerotinia nivalis]